MEQFNVETASLQECVDYSVEQMVKQGGQCQRPNQSVTSGESCAYGNDKGQHCAIGWLLDPTDAGLMKSMDSFSGMEQDERFEGRLPQILRDSTRVFSTLQTFHDADYKHTRQGSLTRLGKLSIDVSAPWFQKWVDMGSE